MFYFRSFVLGVFSALEVYALTKHFPPFHIRMLISNVSNISYHTSLPIFFEMFV